MTPRLGPLRHFMVALAVAALTAVSPWPLGAQQDGFSDVPDTQTEESRQSNPLHNNLTRDPLDMRLDTFQHKSDPFVLAAATAQTQARTAAAGGKGEGDERSLAAAATNPIANLIQFQLQNVFIPNTWESSGYANQFFIQPVIPIDLHNQIFPTLITRTTLPIVNTANPDGPIGATTGSGDIIFLAGAVNNQPWGMWGVGPTFTFPTASDARTGSEKWQAGPTAVVFVTKFRPWQFGVLAYTQHSFAGTSRRENVSKMFWQPILIRHFDKGWYAGLPDILSTTNFRNGENTISFTGLRVGKVTKIGKLPINVFLQSWGTPVHEGPVGKFNIKLSVSFLFPK